MKNFFLERQLRRIEREVSNDLLMILEVGPQYYSNQELYELIDELQMQESRSKRLQRHFFLFLVLIPAWVCGYFLANAFGWGPGAQVFFYLIPASFLTFLSGNLYCRYRYRNCRHANLIRSIIQQELERRRKDASIS
ncbi:MAG: hypothetical protein R2824_16830 [Saprospiraceae bacterium]|nr:hypothetical protein [Lewinella sp.]